MRKKKRIIERGRKTKLLRALNNMLDLMYPKRCPVCGDIVRKRGADICPSCERKLRFVEEPFCLKCGKPLEDESEYCGDCMKKEHSFKEGRAALIYDEHTSQSIYSFKYNSRCEYAKYYGRIITTRLGRKIKSWKPDVIIPVPIHKSKLKKRGYNQAALIAKEISKSLNIPYNDKILIRKTSTKVQKNLSAKDREINLKKAFIVRGNSVKLKSALVVDDIYTTGSTIDAISKCLKGAGIGEIYFVTLSIGRGI